jgi:hypothetical protein
MPLLRYQINNLGQGSQFGVMTYTATSGFEIKSISQKEKFDNRIVGVRVKKGIGPSFFGLGTIFGF